MSDYAWTMSVTAAGRLREERRQLRDAKADLEAQILLCTQKSEKARIKRQLKKLEGQVCALDARLEGAPPAPVSEAEVVARILEYLAKYKARYVKLQNEFLDRVRENPAYAVRWDAEHLIVAQEMHVVVSGVMDLVGAQIDGQWTLKHLIEVCEKVQVSAARMLEGFNPVSVSTSVFSNTVDAAKFKAHAMLVGDGCYSIGYVATMIKWRLEAVAAWCQLQEELGDQEMQEDAHDVPA